MIRFTCQCGKQYQVSEKYAGKKVRCKKCNNMVRVPSDNNEDSAVIVTNIIEVSDNRQTIDAKSEPPAPIKSEPANIIMKLTVSAIAFVLLLAFGLIGCHKYTVKREGKRLQQIVASTIPSPEQSCQNFEFDNALQQVRAAIEQLKASKYRRFEYEKALEEKYEQILNLQKDYNKKIAAGYVVFEDKLILSSERDKVIAAREQEKLSKENAAKEAERQKELAELNRKAQEEAQKFPEIDLSWATLPSGFRGHDIEAIFDILRSKENQIETEKNDFETIDEFRERIKNNLYGWHLIANLSTESIFAFMEYTSASFKYEIDRQAFHTEVSGGACIVRGEDHVSKSVGQNAFGVTKEIECISSTIYGIEADWSWKKDGVELYIDIQPQEAKTIEKQLRLLYIAKLRLHEEEDLFTKNLTIGYTEIGSSFQEATIDQPTQMSLARCDVHVEILQVWVVRNDSGEVLRKFTIGY